jgi:hypothetical protein
VTGRDRWQAPRLIREVAGSIAAAPPIPQPYPLAVAFPALCDRSGVHCSHRM